MDSIFTDWISLLLRWAHLITGIAWIGSSFFFVWLDLSLRRREGMSEAIHGESWIVHGGGFYFIEKYLVAPERLPKELHWFKYEAYFTWITGFLLLAVIYYWGAESYLIDPSVMALTPATAIAISITLLVSGWIAYDLLCRSPIGQRTGPLAVAVFILAVAGAYAFSHLFSGRAAFVQVGAMLGTMMAANVFFVIIPNQKKTVAAMMAGKSPDPKWGKQAKQRSTHNNYLTLPVLLMMISNHYPMTYGHEFNWVIVAVVMVLGGVIRDFFNTRGNGLAIAWQWPLSVALVAGLIWFTMPPADNGSAEPVAATEALPSCKPVVCPATHSHPATRISKRRRRV